MIEPIEIKKEPVIKVTIVDDDVPILTAKLNECIEAINKLSEPSMEEGTLSDTPIIPDNYSSYKAVSVCSAHQQKDKDCRICNSTNESPCPDEECPEKT